MISEKILKRKVCIEKKIGKKIVIRWVRKYDPLLTGKIYKRGDDIVIEFNDRVPGFFWQEDVISELLTKVEDGTENLTLRDSC